MKSLVHKLVLATIMVAGLLIGVVKGQDARSKWVSKMRNRQEEKKVRSFPAEIVLDEYEIHSFHS